MKNLKKVLAVMTAVTAMAASTSAFAANIAEVKGGVTGTYAEGKLSVTTPAAADTSKGDMTLLVLTEGAFADNKVDDEDILYIDQGTTGFADRGLKTDVLLGEPTKVPTKEEEEEGKKESGHIIKVGYYDAGGNFAIAEGYIKVSAEQADEPQTLTIAKWGDVNVDGAYNANDSGAILNSLIGGTKNYGDYEISTVFVNDIKWGDVNLDGSVNANDSGAILNSLIGGTQTYGDATLNKEVVFTIAK